ncbi:hypothetical protein OG765_37665 [Streptomyces sp. NBC_00555]|uniref:hypothetical protein n=1 Tax=Streptomyces sp. NBC_00555 TaxID=2903662 RepID=UPI00225735E1|nr:hypothetical protein [Streptomyces sp. NBC_00555]MCX5016653.1 hypothetical protein [Streptomyces sp. NBC_00555]
MTFTVFEGSSLVLRAVAPRGFAGAPGSWVLTGWSAMDGDLSFVYSAPPTGEGAGAAAAVAA